MIRYKTILLGSIFCFLFSIPVNGQVYKGKQKEIDQILEKISLFSTHLVNGESEKVINSYSTDAKIFPYNMDILDGKELKEYWKPDGTAKVIYHKVTPSEIMVVKKTAYDFGYYEGTTKLEDGSEINWKGKYVIVWKKVGKEWKIYLDSWNRIDDEIRTK